jgi:hypothetical protein
MRDRPEHDRLPGAQAQGRGYDEEPPYAPVEPDDYLTVTPPRPFGPPEKIAALTGAKPKGRGWKAGLCPICDERELSIWWGRYRDKTMVYCNAANHCPPLGVVKEISKRHNVSLDLRPVSAKREPRRRLSEMAGMDAIERALWHCTRAEQRLYQFLKKRGDGRVRFGDMPVGKNAGRGIPVLEYLGLIEATRGGFDPYGKCRPATSYKIARLKLHHRLDGDDRKLKADLKAIRKANVDLDPKLKQGIKQGSQTNYTCTWGKRTLKMTATRTEPHRSAASAKAAPEAGGVRRRELRPSVLRRRRHAARLAGARVFVRIVGQMVQAHGGWWEGAWSDLLAAVERPRGLKAWPLSKRGVMATVWLGREALQEFGLKHEWVHVDALSGRRVLVAIRFAPSASQEEVAVG